MEWRNMKMAGYGRKWLGFLISFVAVLMLSGIPASASDDNSLASLGILTEGVKVEPDFSYDHWE